AHELLDVVRARLIDAHADDFEPPARISVGYRFQFGDLAPPRRAPRGPEAEQDDVPFFGADIEVLAVQVFGRIRRHDASDIGGRRCWLRCNRLSGRSTFWRGA